MIGKTISQYRILEKLCAAGSISEKIFAWNCSVESQPVYTHESEGPKNQFRFGGTKMADHGPAEQRGKRQHPRYKTNIPATLTTDKGEFQINIIQISRAGCLVFPTILQFSDPTVNLTFHLDEESPPFRTVGRIIYTLHNRASGIAFSGLSGTEWDSIDRFLSARGT